MNQRLQNILSVVVLFAALVIGSSEWLRIGGSIQPELPPSAEACCTTARAG